MVMLLRILLYLPLDCSNTRFLLLIGVVLLLDVLVLPVLILEHCVISVLVTFICSLPTVLTLYAIKPVVLQLKLWVQCKLEPESK
jgi:hypothetical protein